MAKFLIQVIGVACSKLHQIEYSQTYNGGNKSFIHQEISHLLLFLIYMFQSGRYVRITRAAQELSQLDHDDDDAENMMYNIENISQLFQQLSHTTPYLTTQWLYILNLLNHCPQQFWMHIISPLASDDVTENYSANKLISKPLGLNLNIVRTGGIILFCDFLTDNISNVDSITWFLMNYVPLLIENRRESPVKDFIMSIHRSQSISGLLLQAVVSRWAELFNHRSIIRLNNLRLFQFGVRK